MQSTKAGSQHLQNRNRISDAERIETRSPEERQETSKRSWKSAPPLKPALKRMSLRAYTIEVRPKKWPSAYCLNQQTPQQPAAQQDYCRGKQDGASPCSSPNDGRDDADSLTERDRTLRLSRAELTDIVESACRRMLAEMTTVRVRGRRRIITQAYDEEDHERLEQLVSTAVYLTIKQLLLTTLIALCPPRFQEGTPHLAR